MRCNFDKKCIKEASHHIFFKGWKHPRNPTGEVVERPLLLCVKHYCHIVTDARFCYVEPLLDGRGKKDDVRPYRELAEIMKQQRAKL